MLERRLGIPITLSVLVMEVGRRVGLAVTASGCPDTSWRPSDGVLFDPFNGGALVSRAQAGDVVARVLGRAVPLEDGHFVPVPKTQILVRMLANLRSVYVDREAWVEGAGGDGAADAARSRLARPRARLRHGLDEGRRLRAGRRAVGALSDAFIPNARDAERVKAQLTEIRRAIASLN